MRYLPFSLFLASPALAHSGPHLHPHDGAGWLAVGAGLAVLALGLTLWARR